MGTAIATKDEAVKRCTQSPRELSGAPTMSTDLADFIVTKCCQPWEWYLNASMSLESHLTICIHAFRPARAFNL